MVSNKKKESFGSLAACCSCFDIPHHSLTAIFFFIFFILLFVFSTKLVVDPL
jgi:hypothetical protein